MTPSKAYLRRDLLKMGYLAAALAATGALFAIMPSLLSPTLLSIVFTMLLSPQVAALERRGYSRRLSILAVFALIGALLFLAGALGLRYGEIQWESFKDHAPEYFWQVIEKMRSYEAEIKRSYPIFADANITDSILQWGLSTGKWFVENGPALIGGLFTWIFLVPLLTFVLLDEGREIRKRAFHLVPNRFFELVFLVTNKISTVLSEYIRAKLVEAALVGLMTCVGLAAVRAPYAIVLGVLAGVTNIIPYAGPVIGAVSGLIIPLLDPSLSGLLVPMLLVYVAVNVIDTVVIFPVIVAKLVNLHPLILLAAVAVGQKYYGLVGMLVSIPIASTFKVILTEIYSVAYESRGTAASSTPPGPPRAAA